MELNLNQNSISRYETEEREADYATLIALADYFNVSLEYMLGISDTRSYSENRKIGSEIFGLTDNSMTILEDLKKQSHIFNVSCFEDNVFASISISETIGYSPANFSNTSADVE